MYNRKKFSQVVSLEKMLREEDINPKTDTQRTTEKSVDHRTGVINTITEKQMLDQHEDQNINIIEKVLNEATSSYVDHRKAEANLLVPPINTIVEKMRLDRLSSDFHTEQTPNWTVEQRKENKDQLGALPEWPKHPVQNDISTGKMVLNNDPRRFEGKKPKPLIGNITTANVNNIARAIKNGQTLDHDTAIVAILKQADAEQRELSDVEQKTIVELKKLRTKAFL